MLGYFTYWEVKAVLDKDKEEVNLRPLVKGDLRHMAAWDQDAEIGYFFGFDR